MDAIEKTLSVLDALDGARSRLGDIAERAQLPKSTVHRILRRLVERGFARAEGDGVYVLGPRVLTMAGEMLQAARRDRSRGGRSCVRCTPTSGTRCTSRC